MTLQLFPIPDVAISPILVCGLVSLSLSPSGELENESPQSGGNSKD